MQASRTHAGKGSVGVACAASADGVVIKALQPGGAAVKSGKVSVSLRPTHMTAERDQTNGSESRSS